MKIEVETTERTAPLILKQLWIEGEADKGEVAAFELCCGAGVGNPLMMLDVTLRDGSHLYDHFDITEFVRHWAAKLATVAPETARRDGWQESGS